MYGRYQASYERLRREELPDTSDPADGRFWKAGVAQGVSTDPYHKWLAMSGKQAWVLPWTSGLCKKRRERASA